MLLLSSSTSSGLKLHGEERSKAIDPNGTYIAPVSRTCDPSQAPVAGHSSAGQTRTRIHQRQGKGQAEDPQLVESEGEIDR